MDRAPLNCDNGIVWNGLCFQPRDQCLLLATSGVGPSSSETVLARENGGSKGDTMPASSRGLVPHQQSNNNKSASTSSNVVMTMIPSSVNCRHQLVEYLPKPYLPDIHPPLTRFPYQNESRLRILLEMSSTPLSLVAI